ncbi:hypothetical protein F4801DRAFT_600753 [Xylaria longipes]|nr:hypothetical protein F4801DRAFT_600753 [Xylaria longipes]
MSSANNPSNCVLATALENISAQLDGTTGIAKIPTSLFCLLDTEGQTIAASHASLILGYAAQFYLDSTDPARVYLANLADINVWRPCEARIIQGYSLPVMSQPVGHPNHPHRVNTQQPNTTQPPAAPRPPPSTPRVKRKRATRRPDGFTAYRSHQWPFLKQENPGIKKSEICAILRARWANMTEEERRPFSELAGSHYTGRR